MGMSASLQKSGEIRLLSKETRLGYVHYTVANLENQIEFYTNTLGFQLHWRNGNEAGLGTGKKDLIRFTENMNAIRYPQTTGLYHQAFLLPERKDLARLIKKLSALRYRHSPTDHIISQTTYLDDPEGNTLEFLVDTPEEGSWEYSESHFTVRDKTGHPRRMTEPLDLERLLMLLGPDDDIFETLPEETITGHIHLYVNDLNAAMEFYNLVLGFERQNIIDEFRMGDVTLPGFNVHIIAFNTWKGHHAKHAPEEALGMKYFTIDLVNQKELDEVEGRIDEAGLKKEKKYEGLMVRDPVGNKVVLKIRN